MSAFCQLDVHLSPPFAKEVRGGLWNNTTTNSQAHCISTCFDKPPPASLLQKEGTSEVLKKQFGRLRTFIKPKSVIRPPGIYFVTFQAFQVLSPCQRHLVCRFVSTLPATPSTKATANLHAGKTKSLWTLMTDLG